MATVDSSFTATGKRNDDYGFTTGGVQGSIKEGVYVTGTDVGVHGFGDVKWGNGKAIGVRGDGKWGVFGFGKETGVTGVGYGKSDCGLFGIHTEGEGFEGDSPDNHKTFGPPGAGVYGQSKSAYGGVFSSDKRAQINLVPKLDYLPPEGQAGDLIFLLKALPTELGSSELWLSVTAGDSNKNPAYWRQVQLGPPVPAQG